MKLWAERMMEQIPEFYDDSVEEGSIYGTGSPKAASAHLRNFRGLMEDALALIAGGYPGACDPLEKAVEKSDGRGSPPDFIAGPAVDALNNMLQEVMERRGCG